MTNTDSTLLVFLLDRSGSMQSIKDDVEGAFSAYIEDQRKVGGSATVSLHQFDDRYEDVYLDRPLAEVRPLQLRPRGSTALLDAMGRTITATRERIAALPEDRRPGTVHFNIMSDGHENASREFTRPAIRRMVEAQEKADNWLVAYMGCDQDAVEIGAALGVSADRSLTFTRDTVVSAMASVSAMTTSARDARRAGASMDELRAASAFSADQRRDAGE
jgi:hypothetical protein